MEGSEYINGAVCDTRRAGHTIDEREAPKGGIARSVERRRPYTLERERKPFPPPSCRYGTGSDHRSVELSSGLVGASKGHGSVPGEAARGGGVRRPLQDSGDGLGSVPGGNGMMGGGGGLRRGVGGGVIGGGGTGGPIGGPGASWKWWR